jgi:hypothetical protein
MIKTFIQIFSFIFICSCATQSITSAKLPKEFVGTWKLEQKIGTGSWHVQNFSNGKSVTTVLAYGAIFAYEANWWVEDNILFKQVTKSLYTDEISDQTGQVTKEYIEYATNNKLILRDSPKGKAETYIKLAGTSPVKKYQKIDRYLLDLQSNLPNDDGKGNIWLSSVRHNDTIINIYQKTNQYKNDFNSNDYKEQILGMLRNDSEIVSDQMYFKFIYLFEDDKMSIIKIKPNDYIK